MSRSVIASLAIVAGFTFSAHAGAQVVEQSRSELARQIYADTAADINHEAPQPLLRAVVVMRIRLGDDGRWTAEVVRDNPNQPEMTQKALATVARAPAPANVPEGLRDTLRREGFVEIWLFQTDGRFALRTLALPQRQG